MNANEFMSAYGAKRATSTHRFSYTHDNKICKNSYEIKGTVDVDNTWTSDVPEARITYEIYDIYVFNPNKPSLKLSIGTDIINYEGEFRDELEEALLNYLNSTY